MNLAFYYLNNNSQTSPHRPKKVFNNANCHYKKTIIDKNILSLSILVQFDQQPKPISRMIKTNNLCKNSYLCLRRDRYKNPQTVTRYYSYLHWSGDLKGDRVRQRIYINFRQVLSTGRPQHQAAGAG